MFGNQNIFHTISTIAKKKKKRFRKRFVNVFEADNDHFNKLIV